MTRTPVGARSTRVVVGLQAVLLALFVVAAPAAAEVEDEQPGTTDGAAIALGVSGVVGDGADEGDFTLDPDTGLPTLTFRPDGPAVQTAVYAYTVTNTGTVPLRDVTVVDDDLGTVLGDAAAEALQPGASLTVRAERLFTYDQVAGGTAGLLSQRAVATASDDQGTGVTAEGEAVVQLVAVSAAAAAPPRLELTKEVVRDAGDVTTDEVGMAVVAWTATERAADEPRVVRYRLTVANTGGTTIHGVEVVDELLGDEPVLAATEGRALAPGELLELEVDLQLWPADVLPADAEGADGWVEEAYDNVASATGRDEGGDVVAEASAEARLLLRAELPAEVLAEVLPAAGPGGAVELSPGGAAGVALLGTSLVLLGVLLLWRSRPSVVGGPRGA